MLPLSVRTCRGLLVTLTLAALAGCYTEEDARVCENVTCFAGYCIAEEGKPVCHCDAWSQAAGLPCIQVGLAPDDINDIPGTATPIRPSAPAVSGNFDARPTNTEPDVDFYSFQAEAGHVYRVACSSNVVGCAISLRNSEDQSLAEGSGTPAAAVVRELNAGRYTFRLKAQVVRAATAAYELRLEDLGLDDHGDTPADATARSPSPEPFSGRAEDPDDVDVFSLMMTEGHIYRFSCFYLSPRRWWLTLKDSEGVTLGTTAGTSSERLVFEATSSGTAFVELHTAEGTSVQTYGCKFEDLGPDDHGDTLQTASVLVPGAAFAQGRMETEGDTDFFRFTATAAHSYRFRCVGDMGPCTVGLYNGAGTPQPIQSDPFNYGARIFQAQGDGDLFLSVSGATETYSYALEDLGTSAQGVKGINAQGTGMNPGAVREEDSPSPIWSFVLPPQTSRVPSLSSARQWL